MRRIAETKQTVGVATQTFIVATSQLFRPFIPKKTVRGMFIAKPARANGVDLHTTACGTVAGLSLWNASLRAPSPHSSELRSQLDGE